MAEILRILDKSERLGVSLLSTGLYDAMIRRQPSTPGLAEISRWFRVQPVENFCPHVSNETVPMKRGSLVPLQTNLASMHPNTGYVRIYNYVRIYSTYLRLRHK